MDNLARRHGAHCITEGGRERGQELHLQTSREYDYNTECAVRKCLLIFEISVAGEKHIEPRAFSATEEFTVQQAPPPFLRYSRNDVPRKLSGEFTGQILIQEHPTALRASFAHAA
jgi:hypothetical protein